MTQDQAASYLATQAAEIAQATVEDHPERAEEMVSWLLSLTNGEAAIEVEDLKRPVRLANSLEVTSPFQTVDRARVEEWAKAPRGKEWVDEIDSLLTKQS